MLPYNKNLKEPSRQLRKNMTDAEKLLWSKIRRKQLGEAQFYRQKIIGDYIVDFYCPKAKLVIEVDGAQHYEGDVAEQDRIRDDQMRALGQNVLRFSNREVLGNIAGVIEAVNKSLPASLWNSPFPLFSKEGEGGVK